MFEGGKWADVERGRNLLVKEDRGDDKLYNERSYKGDHKNQL